MQVINYFYYKNKNLEIKSSKDNIKSHNQMSTFFSGTDLSTLREEGNDRNHFVSLIVNNAGVYTAAITRKLTVTKTFKYKSFGDTVKDNQDSNITEEVIAYNMLTVIKEKHDLELYKDIDDKIKSIKETKEAKSKDRFYNSPIYTNGKLVTPSINNQQSYQKYLFDDDDYYMESAPLKSYSVPTVKNNDFHFTFPDSMINSITLQLITGSIAIADSSRIDPLKWANQMISLFDKRFPRFRDFEEWAELFTDFIIGNASSNAKQSTKEMEYMSDLATKIIIALSKLPENKYIKTIKDKIALWII